MRRGSFDVDVSLLLTIPVVCLLCIDSVQGEVHVNVSYTGSKLRNTFANYSDKSFFSKQYDNIPGSGIEGHLFLPTPVNACLYIDPPPGGFPIDSTWIALVYDYPSCPSDMVMNVRNAGYKLIIASSRNDSHRAVSKEVSDSLFPIAIVKEYYADYLKENAASNNSTDTIKPFLVLVKGSISLSVAIVTLVCSLIVSTLYCCCYCCMVYWISAGYMRDCLGELRRRNFDHLPRYEQLHRQERAQSILRHEQLDRQELTESIQRHLQVLQRDMGVQIPLGEEETQRLPTRRYNSKKETSDNCVICVDEFVEEDQVRVLPCSHVFHPQCIDEWLVNHSSLCPLCKKEVRIPRQRRSEHRIVTDTTSDERVDLLLPHSQGQRFEQQVMYGSIIF